MRSVVTHWTEADELPKCQHCELPAAEHSFMCEDHAYEADTEVETLREQLRGAVDAIKKLRDYIHLSVEERRPDESSEMVALCDSFIAPSAELVERPLAEVAKALKAHRESWVKANGPDTSKAHPRDRELWAALESVGGAT